MIDALFDAEKRFCELFGINELPYAVIDCRMHEWATDGKSIDYELDDDGFDYQCRTYRVSAGTQWVHKHLVLMIGITESGEKYLYLFDNNLLRQ